MTVFNETVTPVRSPGFAATHAHVLARPVAEWGSVPFLRLARSAQGWATWHGWFGDAGYPLPRPTYIGIKDYVYLIEAAVVGQGQGGAASSTAMSTRGRWSRSPTASSSSTGTASPGSPNLDASVRSPAGVSRSSGT